MQQVSSCPNCHSPVQPNGRFCVNCGISLSPSSPSSGQQTQVKSSKERDRMRCFEWLRELFQIRGEAGPIIQRISQVDNASDQEKRIAFLPALEKLPSILERLKTLAHLEGIDMKTLRRIQELEVNGLDDYITYCRLSMDHLNSPHSFRYAAIALKLASARKYWESSARESSAFLRKLRVPPEESESILRMLGL